MPVNLSIKNAPDELVLRLKDRAARNHRSMQGEMIAILDAATRHPSLAHADIIDRLAAEVKAIGRPSPAEAVQMVREDRDR